MKILEQTRISPPPGSIPEPATLPLTFFDVIWLDHPPVERCFFYHLPDPTSHLPALKSSLSLTLQRFRPLAANLVPSPRSDDRFELRCTENDSVPFTVVEVDDNDDEIDFVDVAGPHPRQFSKLESLVPQPSESLLAVQITVFPNHGVCIGLSIRHVACDGFSYIHFVKTWAENCRSAVSSIPPPFYDRSALASVDEFYPFIIQARPHIKSMQVRGDTAETDFVSATVKLGSEHIAKLKQSVRPLSSRASTFVVTCAYLLGCSLKLRGIGADQTVCFPIAVDWRQRLQPRAPAWYFGNCVFFSVVFLKAGDILKDDGLSVASEAIGEVIEELKEGIGKSFGRAKGMMDVPASTPVLTIAGSPRMRVYDTDFGWGKPVKVEIVSIKNEGVALAESREDPGGVEIGLVLSKKEMEEFIAIFNHGLELL